MRCPRCGNENPGTNRFCGMCGATLLPPPAISTEQHAAAQAPTAVSPLPPRPAPATPAPTPRSTSEPRATAATPDREPAISGPSFLGLNQPSANQAASTERPPELRRASLSIDPKAAPSSRNLNYLLEDDEPKSGGAGKFFLIVLALLLAVGLGYLRWKNQGLGWLSKSASKPPAATDSADSADSNAPASSTSTNSNSSSPSTPSSSPPSASPSASAPPPDVSPSIQPANQPGSTDSTSSAAPPNGNAANRSSSAPGSSASSPSADATTAADNTKDPNAASADTAPAPVSKPAAPKPVAKPTRSDPVTEARKYLYGKGAKQDCKRGMHLLKSEADRSNPKAMTEMGALYSAGLCTPHDLPTAYRWFALALRKDPDNQELQGDLQKLWGEMTQPERQQAIRLSQ